MVEFVTVARAETCTCCGSSFEDIPYHQYERRTRIDIVVEKVAEYVDAEIKQCLNCKSTVKGKFPVEMHGKRQYGNGLKAFVMHLIVSQNRGQKQVPAMIGNVTAEATLLKFVSGRPQYMLMKYCSEFRRKTTEYMFTPLVK